MLSILSFSYQAICVSENNMLTYYSFNEGVDIACKLKNKKILVCNRINLFQSLPDLADKLKSNLIDILDIFVLLYPKAKCAPSINSIYKYIFKRTPPAILDDKALLQAEIELMQELYHQLSLDIKKLKSTNQNDLLSLAYFLQVDEPMVANFLFEALPTTEKLTTKIIEVWHIIPEYNKNTQVDNIKINSSIPADLAVEDAMQELQQITAHKGGMKVEQQAYVATVSKMFQNAKAKQLIFAEAGTGTGKTLGYIASTLAFLQANPQQQVLISTYSKALQQQIYHELQNSLSYSSLRTKIAMIKGNNNYICLLNYEYLLNNSNLFARSKLFLAVLSLWLKGSEYGDLIGGNLSSLIFHLFSQKVRNFVLNQHDECLYSKCKHFKKCFVINTKKKACEANIIVSNHYYSLSNANLGVKYAIFDEAHHLLNTADEVFSFNISVRSMAQFNYWLFGKQNNKRSSLKKTFNGLKSRLHNLLSNKENDNSEIKDINALLFSLMDTLLEVCTNLVTDVSFISRMKAHQLNNLMERYLFNIYQYVLAHHDDLQQYYSLETVVNQQDFSDNFNHDTNKLIAVFEQALSIGSNIYSLLQQKITLVSEDDKYEIEDFIKLFEHKFIVNIVEYINMLNEMIKSADKDFIYRFVIDKEAGKISNIAYYKNYINPAQPLANSVFLNLNFVTLTSATLSGANHSNKAEIAKFKQRLIAQYGGAEVLDSFNISTTHIKSTFNYQQNSKIIIINNNQNNLSTAIESLFKAGGGGGLALFTALSRLNLVYQNIYKSLQASGINLMSANVNNQKIENLIDIFKDDENSCLLGSDSARDGIDIPGKALRLVIFEKTPWAKVDLLHKARVKHLGSEYSLELIRLKLRQALGRIIRTHEDKGIFIVLDKAFPSSLKQAFPQDAEIYKLSLNEALKVVKNFLSH